MGVRIYQSTDPNTAQAKFFIPSSSPNNIQLHLIHNFEEGDPVVYNMGIGVENSAQQPFWRDPTISFEPQQPPDALSRL